MRRPRSSTPFFGPLWTPSTVLFVCGFLLASPHAVALLEVRLRPFPQSSPLPKQITIVSAPDGVPTQEKVRVPVREGRITVPAWLQTRGGTIQAEGFEPYTVRTGPLSPETIVTLRALGKIRGRLEKPYTEKERITWVGLASASTEKPVEVEVAVDSGGFFEIARPGRVYNFAIVRRGFAPKMNVGVVVEPGRTTSLGPVAMRPGVAAAFTVVDSKTGVAIPGAEALWDPDRRVPNAALTRELMSRFWSAGGDGKGSIRLSDLPEVVRFRIEAPGHQAKVWAPPRLQAGSSVDLGTVPLARLAGIAISTIRPDALASAALHLTLFRFEETENEEDFVRIAHKAVPFSEKPILFEQVEGGAYRAILRDHRSQLLAIKEFSVGEELAEITLQPRPKRITGRVTLAKSPVADATVLATLPRDASFRFAEGKTETDGRFDLELYQEGDVLVTALTAHASGRGRVKLSDQRDEAWIEIEIPPAGVRGMIRDSRTGKGIREALIKFVYIAQDGVSRAVGEVRSDEDGFFAHEGLESGRARLTVSASKYRSRVLELMTSPSEGETVRIDLDSAPSLVGTVLDETGRRVPGAILQADFPDAVYGFDQFAAYSAVTDGEGNFRFESPPPDGTLFYVAAPGHTLTLVALAAERTNEVVVTLPGGAPLVLLDGSGNPLRGVEVFPGLAGQLFPRAALESEARLNGATLSWLTSSGPDGSVPLPLFLAPGRYTFFARERPKSGQIVSSYVPLGEATLPLSAPVILQMPAAAAARKP